MIVVTTFADRASVTTEPPAGTRWNYACTDGPATLVTHDLAEVAKWMADPERECPVIEPREIFAGAAEEEFIEQAAG